MIRGFSLGHCGRGFKSLWDPTLKDCLSFTIPCSVKIIIIILVNFIGDDGGSSSSSSVKVLTLMGFID